MNAPYLNLPNVLSDADVARLDALLEAHAVPNDGMSLEMLDGFLSALVVGPQIVPPSEYWGEIWAHEPAWSTPEELGEAQRLVNGLWNDIIRRLSIPLDDDDDEAHALAMPLLAYPAIDEDEESDEPPDVPEDFPLAAAWAVGFLHGVELRREAWDAWSAKYDSVDDDLDMLYTLTLFDPEQAKEAGLEADDIPDFRERLDMVQDLPEMLQDLQKLRMDALRPQTVRTPEGPGRNDPCPCGSGQKYKKCCGAPKQLH